MPDEEGENVRHGSLLEQNFYNSWGRKKIRVECKPVVSSHCVALLRHFMPQTNIVCFAKAQK